MAKRKISKSYETDCLGFPIILENVPMIFISGEWVPEINYDLLQKCVLYFLCVAEARLTGNQIKFIRSWFRMSLQEMGSVLGVTRAAIKKWEDFADQPTNMSISTERNIRLFILEHIMPRDRKSLLKYREYVEKIINEHFSGNPEKKIKLDYEDVIAA